MLDGKSQEPRHEMEIDSEDLGSPEEDAARRRHGGSGIIPSSPKAIWKVTFQRFGKRFGKNWGFEVCHFSLKFRTEILSWTCTVTILDNWNLSNCTEIRVSATSDGNDSAISN